MTFAQVKAVAVGLEPEALVPFVASKLSAGILLPVRRKSLVFREIKFQNRLCAPENLHPVMCYDDQMLTNA